MIRFIQQAAADAIGCPWREMRVSERPARTYQSNRLYDAHAGEHHLIVKEFLKPEEFGEAPVREFEGLRLLASQGLDIAPQPLLLRPAGAHPHPLVVYDYMTGEMWDRRRPSAQELADLAALWLRVNDVWSEDLWPSRGFELPLAAKMARFERLLEDFAAWADVNFPQALPAARLCLDTLHRRRAVVEDVETLSALHCFCRADARFANIIARPNGEHGPPSPLGMVDWEDCGLRDPALDLADIVTAPNQEDLLSWDEWQPFLQPYIRARRKHDAQLEKRLYCYLGLYPLAWLAWLLTAGVARAKAGKLCGWHIHDMAPDRKLRRYLARAIAWPKLDFSAELDALAELAFFPNQ